MWREYRDEGYYDTHWLTGLWPTQAKVGSPLGDMERGSFTRYVEIWMKGALEVERLSLREQCEGNMELGSFSGDPGGCVKEGS